MQPTSYRPVHSARPSPTPATPPKRDSPLTRTLIGINVAIFLLEELWGGSDNTQTLVRMGAVWTGEPRLFHWASLLSYGYLHIGALHVGMNMFALWYLGRALEPLLGASRLFVLYTLSLLGGGIAIAFKPGPGVTAGASGALFGLLGAIAVLMLRRYRASRLPQEKREIMSMLGRMFLPNLAISLLPGVSLLGHAGGLLIGAAVMYAALPDASSKPRSSASRLEGSPWLRAAAIALALMTVLSLARVWSTFEPWRLSS